MIRATAYIAEELGVPELMYGERGLRRTTAAWMTAAVACERGVRNWLALKWHNAHKSCTSSYAKPRLDTQSNCNEIKSYVDLKC